MSQSGHPRFPGAMAKFVGSNSDCDSAVSLCSLVVLYNPVLDRTNGSYHCAVFHMSRYVDYGMLLKQRSERTVKQTP